MTLAQIITGDCREEYTAIAARRVAHAQRQAA